jgi:RNA polymerase sigma-70 factor (ECF subfamily)
MSAAANSPVLSFDEVYDTHFDYVYRLVARLAGSTEAEDLAQEVFVVVCRRLDSFEGRADIKTWLFQIAYRVVGASIRKQRMRRLLAMDLKAEASDVSTAIPRSLERAEQGRALAKALRKLSFKKRAVIILHDVENWPCATIAERLGVPTNTIYTRLHHARKALAKGMRSESFEGKAK